MTRVLEKVERRLGEKLLLKPDRCMGPKCALIRRNSLPGAHGRSRRKKRGGSEFGLLLSEKQKIRYLYGLDDHDLARYNKTATQASGIFSRNLVRLLEQRLDNVVFRLGLAPSRRIARQMVGHKHVTVNGRTVNIPSYQVSRGDAIGLKENILASPLCAELNLRLKNYNLPPWLALDKEKKIGTVLVEPGDGEIGIMIDITRVKEFYSQ